MAQEPSPIDLVFREPLDQVGLFEQGGSIPALLQRIVNAYGLCSAAYLAVNLPNARLGSPYIAATYSDAWVAHYRAQEYHRHDPVVLRGFDSLMPMDWGALDKSALRTRRLFDEAHEHGVGRHGLLFPIRGRHGERAIFTLSANEGDQVWIKVRRQLVREFQIIANHTHRLVLAHETIAPSPVRLTEREIDCLRWAALGKSKPATAVILGISEKTVMYYLENVRAKLDACNVTNAVAKAISMNLFTLGM